MSQSAELRLLASQASGERLRETGPGMAARHAENDGASDRQGPARVLREYPRPAPEDHVPFPLEALNGSLSERFEAQVRLHPQRVALRTPGRQWSYAELNASANRAAHAILGAGGSSPVVLLMDQEDPAIPALFGVLKASRPYVFLDPGDPPERWQAILEATDAELLITTAARMTQSGAVRIGKRLCWEELEAGRRDDDPGLEIAPDAPAAFFFTSGSTGTPKGVLRDHRLFLQSTWLNTNTFYVSPGDRQTLLYFPGFGASMPNIFDAILNGAAVCALNPRRVSPADLLSWIRTEGITILSPPVGLWRGLLAAVPPGMDWPRLRLVTLGSQQIYGRDIRDFQSRFGNTAVMLFMLAMTEAGPVTRAYIDRTVEVGEGSVPAGYPVAGKDLSILGVSGLPLGPGEEGRVAITSPFISQGYWKDDELTAKHFLRAEGGSVTFLTEDRGLLRPDGCLEFFGRDDSVVKIRGYRVDLSAVEAVLNGHPAILSAAVVAGMWRGSESRMAAYVVPKAEAPKRSEIRSFVAGRLPAYMVPDHVIVLDEMPLTASGKINRRDLPAPGTSRPQMETPFVPPRNATEARLAGIWAELLELDEIGVDDDFFELGGDSLLAMRMALTVEKEMSHPIPVDFFRAPTVARLALATTQPLSGGQVRAESGNAAESDMRERPPLRRRLLRAVSGGPLGCGCCLSYAPGLALQKMMIAQPWLRRRFDRNVSLVRKWSELLGVATDPKELATISLLANTWRVWRSRALESPAVLGRWLMIDDAHHYLSDCARGIVLAVPHTGRTGGALLSLFARSGRLTASVANDASLGPRGATSNWTQQQIKARSEMLWNAHQVLKRGGVVMVVADGLHGEQSIEVPFFGRRRPFQIGAAELAVTTGAAFVPVFSWLDVAGRVWIEVDQALAPEGDSPRARIAALTRRYAEAYVDHWPRIFASMNWNHLEFNLGLSEA